MLQWREYRGGYGSSGGHTSEQHNSGQQLAVCRGCFYASLWNIIAKGELLEHE